MSKNNPYNLPPPWNPGYAVPQNVVDEGLERHGYVTQWAPRGSFDNPKVGHAGYAVPGYVREERYGQGAMTTRWAPRGTYAGPKVPHWLDHPSVRVVGRKPMPGGATKLKIETMAGVEQAVGGAGNAPITAYGLNAAKALIDTVKMMPPDLRKRQLKAALDKIDPKLWAKAEAGAAAETKLGVPADIALERGLGAAMSYGLSTELVALAKGKRPPERSQLGACLPCAATMLGEDPTRAGYCWIAQYVRASDGQTVPGHWERMRSGQTSCVGAQPAGVAAPTVRTGSSGGVTVTSTATGQVVTSTVRPAPAPTTFSASPKAEDQAFLHIGPFLIPTNVGGYRDHRTLTADKKAYVDQNIAIAAKAGGISIAEMKKGAYPFVRFKANNGEAWGLFYIESDGTQKTSRGTLLPKGTTVSYHKIAASQSGVGAYESLGWSLTGAISDVGGAIRDAAKYVGGGIASVFKKVWAGIKWVAIKVAKFVVEAVKWVAKQTCRLTTTPGVVQGAQAIAMAAPNPYTVGIAAGITVTKMICDKVYGSAEEKAAAEAAAAEAAAAEAAASAAAAAAAAAEAEAAEKRKKMMPLLLLGGAGVIGAVLFLGKKK
jgi:hypothetical protein